MRKTSSGAPWVLGWVVLIAGCGSGTPEEFARASVIESLADGVGGPKAIAQKGDLILENQHLKLAILDARNSLGPGLYGGSIVDADLQRTDPTYAHGNGRDQFTEMFATVNMNVPLTDASRPESVQIVQDGADGGPAIVRVDGPATPFLTLLGALWALVQAPDWWMTTDYIAEPGADWIRMKTTIRTGLSPDGPEAAPIGYFDDGLPLLDWAIETGMVVGEFYLQGGSVDVFAPGIGFDEDGAVFRSMQAGDNTFNEPFQFPFLAGVGDGVSYAIAPVEGDLYVPLFTASQTVAVGGGVDGDGSFQRFPDGTAYTYERYFFVGHGDVGSLLDQYIEARGIEHGAISGSVTERTTGTPLSGIDVFVFEPGAEYPWSHFETDVHPDDHQADGSFGGNLPVGSWELLVHDRGRPASKRVPIEVKPGGDVQIALMAERTGVLTFTVRDEVGRAVPSKVSLFRMDDKEPRRDPALRDGFIAGSPEAVLFSLYGDGEVELAPGRYQAIASRGLEYELGISEPFEIDQRNGAHLDLQVIRSVDTTGWVSADLHVHAVNSHDSGVLLADRVRTMAAEGVEFFASTDHDYLVDYAPTVELLGMEPWVQTAVGNEVTTIEVGHFLGFPLKHDFLAEAGGGREEVDWTGETPHEILTSIREMGRAAGHEPVTFVGHPRDGILGYFDQYGFDPYGGIAGFGGNPGQASVLTPVISATNPLLTNINMVLDFDALELLNAKRFELIRTPTQPELDGFAAGDGTDVRDLVIRTMAEQEDLKNGVYRLGAGIEGHIDDWFTLLNLGFRFTVLGNSDTHSLTSTESGCPRNYVISDTDDPELIDDQAIADAVKDHRVVASYGPFVQMWLDGEPIGSEITGTGPRDLRIEIQAPTWIGVNRVELYENGTLIQEFDVPPSNGVYRFDETTTVEPTKDSWYVVSVMGDGDLAPVFTPVEIPYVELQLIVGEALGGIESVSGLLDPAIPIPREYPILPYAITNPIWVDLAGDGFDAPGIPDWLEPPIAPEL